jgi:hypothetical protein
VLQREREARSKIEADLAAERKELIHLLTPNQEALMVAIGLVN